MTSHKILLIRHAKPVFDTRARVRAFDMRRCLSVYENALKRAGWAQRHSEGNGYGASTMFVHRAVTPAR